MKIRRVNVSSVQSFINCPFRWWCEYVQNRVPVATAPALDTGRVLHRIFERHFRDGEDLIDASRAECASFEALIPTEHPSARASAEKALKTMRDLEEALPLWVDDFRADKTLAVEEPFELQDERLENVLWVMRPDVEITKGRYLYHRQNRGLAASMNFAQYVRLMNWHFHEHLYAKGLTEKWIKSGRLKGFKYGGTQVNLIRKLQYRTNAGKKNEATKTAAEMFYQQTFFIDTSSKRHKAVMASLRYWTSRMVEALEIWEEEGIAPCPNPKQNGGFSGSSEDAFFRVLMGEITLDDDNYFKDRLDPYAQPAEEQ